MSIPSRTCLALLLALAPAPLFAQAGDPVETAFTLIESHKVSTRTGCSVPIPATWNAPPWQQEAAWRRREAFNACLDRAMTREQDRLQELTWRVDDIRIENPNADWSGVDAALDSKWAELQQVESKLANQENWANTAVTILDTFTGPGAPFDSSPLNPTRNPMGLYGGYRRDSSVSAAGIK